jgi:hypothetical protein
MGVQSRRRPSNCGIDSVYKDQSTTSKGGARQRTEQQNREERWGEKVVSSFWVE